LDITVSDVDGVDSLFVFGHVGVDGGFLECSEVFIRYGSSDVVVLAVEDLVPDGVELIGGVVAREREGVGTLISLGVLVVESGSCVERLVQVSNIVDKETKSIRSGSVVVSRVERVLDVIVHVGLLVSLSVLA